MAVSVEAKIANALLARLASFTHSPPLPVSYPGIAFTPPSGIYLHATLLSNANRNQFVGDHSSTEHRGILQVSVMAPRGSGIVAGMEIAGKIASHFERASHISGDGVVVHVSGRPSVATAIQEPDRINIPVSIFYFAFA